MHDLDDDLLSDLKKLPFLGEHVATYALSHQGLSNKAYQLDYDGQRYFMKELTSNSFVLLDRKNLFELQQRLSEESLAPKPVHLDHQGRFQIDEWVEEGDFLKGTLSQEQKLGGLAKILAYTHTRKVNAAKLDLQKALSHYTQQIKLEIDLQLSEHIENFERQYQQTNESLLCHNDLSLLHCHSSHSHLAFDWEYAAIGNRFFDIASCIEINKFGADDSERLIERYLLEAKRVGIKSQYTDKQVFDNVNTLRPIVTFTNDLWVLASQS